MEKARYWYSSSNIYIIILAESGESESHSKKKTKRMRTTFTEEQVQILQANFQIDSNPDGQDLERIAQITGLSKRVTQVWFQNCRARQKKYINSGKRGGGGSNNGGKLIGIFEISTHLQLFTINLEYEINLNNITQHSFYSKIRSHVRPEPSTPRSMFNSSTRPACNVLNISNTTTLNIRRYR